VTRAPALALVTFSLLAAGQASRGAPADDGADRSAAPQEHGAEPQEEQEETAAPPLPPPLPQTPVGGVRGVHVRSRLVREGAREVPVDLTFTHIYPDRSRLNFEPASGDPRDARRWMRAGASAWLLDAREPRSRVLAGPERLRELLALELRRALFRWPAGLEGEPGEDARRVTAALVQAENHSEPLGSLHAVVDTDGGRPTRIEALAPDGSLAVSVEVQSTAEDGRPERLFVRRTGGWSGTETVRTVQRAIRYHDTYFVPPDRRETGDLAPRVWRSLDLRAVTLKRVALPEGTGWDEARERRATLAAEAAEELADGPHRIAAAASFEVDWGGRPTAVLLRLETAAAEPPPGWTVRPEGPGLALVLATLDQLDLTRLAVLRRGVPADAQPGAPYVLLFEGRPFEAQVFLGYRLPD